MYGTTRELWPSSRTKSLEMTPKFGIKVSMMSNLKDGKLAIKMDVQPDSPWATASRLMSIFSKTYRFVIIIKSCKPRMKETAPNQCFPRRVEHLPRVRLAGSRNLLSLSLYFGGFPVLRANKDTSPGICN